MTPTQPRKKLTAASLPLVSGLSQTSKQENVVRGATYKMFRGLIIKHHRVHMAPVAVRATFCVRESLSAGLQKSLTPVRTIAHFQGSDSILSLAVADCHQPSSLGPFLRIRCVEISITVPAYQKCTVLTPTGLCQRR